MLKYLLIPALLMPASAYAADLVTYQSQESHVRHGGNCFQDPIGQTYCVEDSLEKYKTDCEPGVECRHMSSGQHYSVQPPLVAGN